jgi:dTDP-4-dehydrorhamnose reductase
VRILLTGADGQVGWELTRLLPALGEMMALNRKQCDLSDPGGLRSVVRKCKPDVLVNAAAYTSVDQAESEPEAARIVNAAAPQIMAEELKRTSGLLVQYSTNYVFDGTKPGSYVEEDSPNPINAYGASKLEGERAIQQSGVDHLILRTSWVYAARGRNFLLTILRLFGEQQELRIVADQIGTPTWSRWIAKQTIEVIRLYSAGDPRCRGIFHMTASGSTSPRARVRHKRLTHSGERSCRTVSRAYHHFGASDTG